MDVGEGFIIHVTWGNYSYNNSGLYQRIEGIGLYIEIKYWAYFYYFVGGNVHLCIYKY